MSALEERMKKRREEKQKELEKAQKEREA